MKRTKGCEASTRDAFIPAICFLHHASYLEQSGRRTLYFDTGTPGEVSGPRASKALKVDRYFWNSVVHVLSFRRCIVEEHQSNNAHQFFRSIRANEMAHSSTWPT